jgi:hypothetical protein
MCNIEDIQYWEEVTVFLSVDEHGSPEQQVNQTDGEFRTYICLNDKEMFDTWRQVKKHLKENT